MEQDAFDYYSDGATFAQEVQEALAHGKTFDEMQAFPPLEAAHVRDVYREGGSELAQWWDGYVSRWD